MSNKTIGIIIAIVVLAAVGIAGAIRLSQDSREQTADQNQAANKATDQKNSDSGQEPAAPAGPVTETLNGCTRTWDQSKARTAAIDTANKFVVFDVKFFGSIKIQLYDKDAPKTVENFLRLVNADYYDCLTFHRVAKGFVIQSGDPTGTGSGGESAFGGEFADELNADTASYKAGYVKGVVAMANRGPNSNTSQFFIMLADAQLPHNYTIFGKVASGQGVVDRIGAVDITPQMGPTDGAPKTPVVIEKATITSK